MRHCCSVCGQSSRDLSQVLDIKRACPPCTNLLRVFRPCRDCGNVILHLEYSDGVISPHPQYRCAVVHSAPCGSPCMASPIAVPLGSHGGVRPCNVCQSVPVYPEPLPRPPQLRSVSELDPVGTRVLVLMSDPFSVHQDEIVEHRMALTRNSLRLVHWVRTAKVGWFPVNSGAVRVLDQ